MKHVVIVGGGFAGINAAKGLGKASGLPTDRVGRVVVEPDLSVQGFP